MKAKDFVKHYYRDARSHCISSNHNYSMKHKFTIIKATNDIGIEVILASGKSEGNAWVNAKKSIKGKLSEAQKVKRSIATTEPQTTKS